MTSGERIDWETLLRQLEADLQRPRSQGRNSLAWPAFERRVRRLCEMVLIRYRGAPSAEVDDVVQDVLLKLQSLPALRRLRAAGSPEGYLVVLIRNTLIDRLRRERLERRWLRERRPEQPAARPAPEDVIALRRQLERLSEEERGLLRLRFWEGLTISEIADMIGVRYCAASQRLFRLISKLRVRMG